MRIWTKKNPNKIKEYKKRSYKKVRCTINGRILDSLRSRTYLAVKNGNKAISTICLIGCEIDYLLYHLQSQFKQDMNWDNYGCKKRNIYTMRYKTFYDMLENVSGREFLIKYYLFRGSFSADAYQDLCRVYLDEYSSCDYVAVDNFEGLYVGETEDFTICVWVKSEKNPCDHFINRFNRRD